MSDAKADEKKGLAGALSGLQLGGAKLKKTAVTADRSKPKLDGYLSKDEVKEYYSEVLDINMETYVDLLGEHTFPTLMQGFSADDARDLIAAHKQLKKEKAQELTGKLKERFAELTQRIAKLIDELGKDSGVFVKLSCRSAKDAVTKESVIATCNKYIEDTKATDDNAKIIALTRAGTDVLRMTSAQQAMDMLVRSDRVYEDLEMALEPENIKRFKQSIIVRRWVPVAADMEFRGFVFDNRLNAMTQYNYPCFFPRLVKHKAKIQESVAKFYEGTVRERLAKAGFTRFIIDFGIIEKKSDKPTGIGAADEGLEIDRVVVIELNPWGPSTDSGLFSFKTEEQSVLCNTKGDLDFRVRTEVAAGIREYWVSATKEWLTLEKTDKS